MKKLFVALKERFFSKKVKKIAFLDGDQPIPPLLAAYDMYLKGIETHLVRATSSGEKEPKSRVAPHFDITELQVIDAKAAGAIQVSSKELINLHKRSVPVIIGRTEQNNKMKQK